MVATARYQTLEEFELSDPPDVPWELIDGELVELPFVSDRHGAYGMTIGVYVGSFILSRRLGRIYTAETGFVVATDPPTIRKPDVGFVRYERLSDDRDQDRTVRVVPDFAVEVISPSDERGAAVAKARMWVKAGVPLVWLGDPALLTVTAFTSGAPPHVHTIDDTLDGGDVVPGFTLAVRDIFSV